MLSREQHPVAWAMLLYELADARDHLAALLEQMQAGGRVEEDDYAIQLGHVFAHLNRAWHGRNDAGLDDTTPEQHVERSRFPSDLYPVG